jgi:CheY-like chemotaxis protein
MMNLRSVSLLIVLASGLSQAAAQQPPVKGRAAAAPAQKAAAPAAAAKRPAPPSKPIAPRNELVVRALLQTDPRTPAELVRAIKILVDLDEAGAAQPLLQKLIDQKLDDAALAALVDEFGSAVFLRIARAEALQPIAPQFTAAALAAAARHARDAKRIAAEIQRLESADVDERDAAVAALRSGRDAAVGALLSVLDDPARQAEHAHVETALVQMGSESLAPLGGALAGADATLKAKVCRILGQLGNTAAIDDLLAPALSASSPPEVRAAAAESLRQLGVGAPDPGAATARLVRAARRRYDRPHEPIDSPLADVTLFDWDARQKKLIAQTLRPRDANLVVAARLAGDARRISPDDAELRRFQLTALAESAAYLAGLDKPLPTGPNTAHDLLSAEGTAVLEDLLAYDLAQDHPVAATVAARLLGEAGQREVLTRHNPQLSPLAVALVARDRRLRFAALEAIVKLSPRDAFPGAHRAVEALGFFAAGSAAPRALVADVHAEEAGRLAAILAEAGYEPDVALDARTAMQLVASDRDYELLLVDALLAVPTSGQFIQQLRRDARTALVPLAVIASSEDRPRAERLVRATPLAEVFVSPQNRAGMEVQIGHLMRRFGRDVVDAAQRLRETEQTLAWLAELSGGKPTDGAGAARRPIYDLRVLDEAVASNLGVPQLAPAAVAVLANLGTPKSQVALLDLASRNTQPLKLRQAAAAAFRENLVRHGPLLSSGEIQRQYDRYNASEALDKPTQQLLASILDALEARAAATQLSDDPTRETATDAKP